MFGMFSGFAEQRRASRLAEINMYKALTEQAPDYEAAFNRYLWRESDEGMAHRMQALGNKISSFKARKSL